MAIEDLFLPQYLSKSSAFALATGYIIFLIRLLLMKKISLDNGFKRFLSSFMHRITTPI